MYNLLKLLPWCLLVLPGCSSLSSKFVTGFQARSITLDGREHRYAVYLPPNYDPKQRWPLLVFLNGKGECGTDGAKHLRVGLAPAIRAEPERWPFVVVLPQKPRSETWWTDHEDLVMAATAAAETEFSIDPKQRFLTGLSQGGHGAWAIGAKHPHLWAAIAPVCGFRIGELPVTALRNTPVWAFHGMADPIVAAQQSQRLVAELKEAGGNPLLTLYDGVGHNSWDLAYRHSGLAEWLSLVASDRIGATYLADPRQITEAELDIEVSSSAETKQQRIQIHAKDAGIKINTSHGEEEPNMRTILDESGLDWRQSGELAHDLVYTPLEKLHRSRFFHHFPPPTDRAAESPKVRVAICLTGKDGIWRFRRVENLADQHDSMWASQIGQIVEALLQSTLR